ncbi:3-methyl-2-oxobutanoate hydroxymethyltransferase [Gulosibacter chungangensis]|uniref:3-methyl-2-oxobutanoate hydroxymethyltransferase n=1 Tax=Gulosibacter chungangensis TaxID=979746 RepID=A0A7J5BD89_9MICO|nr:3-methyl-2-oxobutanoate hydroxymethyltransferase [Gulosibacter chungangensis]KAB1644188.1 3-methyl-2-oxobutanoate hydroxymethyltransferase [Gulosibacter chungangensis]
MTDNAAVKRVRTRHFSRAKRDGHKISGLTAYDAASAQIFDQAGIDFLLVGDSAANVMLGYDTTLPISVNEMITMSRSVARAAKRAFVIADLPFGSYEISPEQALETAVRFMKEAEVHAVKLEGGVAVEGHIRRITESGIPVCAHIGFTPQSEHNLGGHVIQGRGDAAEQLLEDARAIERAGAFLVVLEMVPTDVAAQVTAELSIPTISVGAGPHCDGQLTVWTDTFGYSQGRVPKFVRKYANLADILREATEQYISDIQASAYPSAAESYENVPPEH